MNIFLNIAFCLLSSIIFTLLSYKYFQVIQLGGYTKHRFFKNVFFKDIWTYVLNLIITLCAAALFFIFNNYKFISMAAFALLNAALIFYILKASKKTPLKLTKRMTRQIILFFVFCFAVNFLFVCFKYIYLVYLLEPALPFISLICLYLILPLENLIKRRYKMKAIKKLKTNAGLIKIGITGSYGKTAVKNILHKMLSKQYNVLSTPKSYNTPMGIASCILKDLTTDTNIFICEMGARHKGDIKELCNMVKPSYALINTVGGQHLETFKSLQNIKSEKFELALAAAKLNGYSFFNGDSENGIELYQKYSGNKFLCNNKCSYNFLSEDQKDRIGLIYNSDEFAYAEMLKQSKDGSDFILHIDGFSVKCCTKLLGRHNISNIVLAAACAYKLEVPLEDISKAVEKLESIPHRLEVINGHNNVTVIDDSFNSNTQGFKFALEVLHGFSEGRKILVTPGVVELGKTQYQENFNLAKLIFKVCDYVIVVGKENSKAITDGLIRLEFKNYVTASSLKEAQKFLEKYLKAKDVVLFENDLPDNY